MSDDLYGIEDPIEQADRYYSGRVERHVAFNPYADIRMSQRMIEGRRKWIRKLLGESDDRKGD